MDPDALQDTIPVFCTAAISHEILNEFLVQGLGAPELANPGADFVAVLVDTLDVATITKPSRPPIGKPTTYPFIDWSVEDVIQFSEAHFDRFKQGIVPDHIVILDKQTVEDKTCLLVTLREECDREFLVTAVGGDNYFKPTSPDGVIRLDNLP
ncbi:uncharacterized protein F4822DRAFT_427256 [Hypoxylon trugodes]|uniref:uncharacterized protein n=1 Tax=Hypoxylon trugodes TaxID=326681 RepID=UPI002199C860|nr:uncharacterized protein F4822DRAFT_427256 [Hypoxylon trugodes]KAI1391407.1 hypothetical protein F4822DRAFT_427256 [Hypoxylon trugodes]